MKYISFSLYGNESRYFIGLVNNIENIQRVLPDWTPVVFYGSSIPTTWKMALHNKSRLLAFEQDSSWHPNGMFWRFSIVKRLNFEYVLFRDSDSRISPREVVAIRQWITSRKTLHIIRDHPYHRVPIPGGLWGLSEKVHSYSIAWNAASHYGMDFGEDQRFLARHVYRPLFFDKLVHNTFGVRSPCMPKLTPRLPDGEFIGERFDEHNLWVEHDRRVVKQSESQSLKNEIRKLKISGIISFRAWLSTSW